MENDLDRVHFQEFSIDYDNLMVKDPVTEMKKEVVAVTKPTIQCDKAKAMDEVIMVPVGQEGVMVPRCFL